MSDRPIDKGGSRRKRTGSNGNAITRKGTTKRGDEGYPPPVADPQVTSDAGTRDGNGRFKPGHTGNPGGRPSSTAREFHDRAMKLLRAKGEDGVEEAERLIQGLIRLGVEGNVQAAKLILDRVWPATNVIDATVTDGITAEEGRDTLAAWRRQFVSTGEIPEL